MFENGAQAEPIHGLVGSFRLLLVREVVDEEKNGCIFSTIHDRASCSLDLILERSVMG